MHRYALAAAFVLALATPALAAEFYVALDTSRNECRVVTVRPDDRPTLLKDDTSPSLVRVSLQRKRRAGTRPRGRHGHWAWS